MAFVEIPWAWCAASPNFAVTSTTPPFSVWATASNEYIDAFTVAPVPAGEVTLEVRYSKPTDGTEYVFGLGLDAPFEWIYPPSDLDGGGFYEGWRVAWPPVGVTVWRPKWVVPVGGRPLVLSGRPRPFGTRAATDFSVSGPMTLTSVDGVLRRWEAETYGSTTIYPPKHALSGINGPWVSSTGDAAGKALAVRLNLDGPGRVSVPFYSSGGPLTVHPSSFGGSVALVDAGGAVDNGDGTITIPPSTRCLPRWGAPAGNFAVKMTKTATANYTVSYGPAYVVFAPTLTGIDPTEGTETGGTPALITGTTLAGTIGVDFGGSTATIITTTDTALLVTTPAHPAGTVDVTATDGTTTTDPLSFEYVPVVEPGECPSLTDWCGPDTPCPDCTPCVVAPARPLIAMWADLAAQIRCGWPDDRCPPGAVTVEATQQPPGSDCDAEVQVIPGGPAGADRAGVTTWGGRVVLLRPWAQINEAGQLTDAAQAQRLEALARSLEDLQIMQQLIGATACGSCGPGGAIIDRVERVTSTTTLGWAFAVRIS